MADAVAFDMRKNMELSDELLRLQSLPCAPRELFSMALPEYTCQSTSPCEEERAVLAWTRRLGEETWRVNVRQDLDTLREKGAAFPRSWPEPVSCLRAFDMALRLANAAPARAGGRPAGKEEDQGGRRGGHGKSDAAAGAGRSWWQAGRTR